LYIYIYILMTFVLEIDWDAFVHEHLTKQLEF